MHLRSDRPREGDPHRRLHLGLTALVVILALALVTWLLVRPGVSIADVGASPGAGGSASTAATPSAAPGLTPSAGASPSAAGSPAASATSAAPVPVAFIGDGLTATASTSGTPVASPTGPLPADAQDWAALTTADLAAAGTPITATTAAQDGAGYSAQVPGGLNFAELVPQAVTASTRVVVLLGSSNDAGRSSAAVRSGVQTALSIIAQLAPGARVLLVAPLPVGTSSSPGLRGVLQEAAAAGGATFVDPVAAGWSLDAGTSVDPSGAVDLTPAGQAAVATSVAASVRPLVQAATTPSPASTVATPSG